MQGKNSVKPKKNNENKRRSGTRTASPAGVSNKERKSTKGERDGRRVGRSLSEVRPWGSKRGIRVGRK